MFLTRVNFPYNLEFSVDLNGTGYLNFELDILDTLLTKYNLDSEKNIVELYREGVLWRVYYMRRNVQYTINRVLFQCVDYIQKLDERDISTKTFNGVDGGQAAFTVLSDANTGTNRDTLITSGSEDISTLIYRQYDYMTAFEILQDIRDTVKAQMLLNTDLTLDFKSTVGDSINERFYYNYTDPRNSTIIDFTVLRDFAYIQNDVTGKAGVTTSNQTNGASIGKYGLVEKPVSFPSADTVTDLNNQTSEYVTEHAEPRLLPQVTIDNAKLELSCYNIGDKVPLTIQKGTLDLSDTYQIVQITVSVDDTGFETVNVTLSEETYNNRPPDFFESIRKIDSRLQYVELNY